MPTNISLPSDLSSEASAKEEASVKEGRPFDARSVSSFCFAKVETLFVSAGSNTFRYQTGILCPYQIWREMHQSRRFSIQWKYVFSKRSGIILIDPLSTVFFIISFNVVSEPA